MIVVTTPTGEIGHQVLESLVAEGDPVRVIVRDPARLPNALRERIEVAAGSHGDPATIDAALTGADALFWVVPPNPRAASLETAYLDFTRPACDAVRKHGVSRVVSVSALGRGTPWEREAGLVTASLAMDDLLAATGAAFRALVMPSFMENLLRQVEPIRTHGVFASTIDPDRKAPTCATQDIAAAAVRLLRDPSWTGRGEQPVLGPEDLSPDEMAAIMAEVLERPVRYQQVSDDAFAARLREGGTSEAFVAGYRAMMRAKNAGMDNAEARTTESSSPTRFRDWCETVLKPAVLA